MVGIKLKNIMLGEEGSMKIGYFFPRSGGGSNENRSFFMLLKRRLEVDPQFIQKKLKKCHGGEEVVKKIGHFLCF